MSRGLGRLQREILATLQQNSEPLKAQELAWLLHNCEKSEREYEPAPHSLEVAVRRAIRSLEQRSLIKTAYRVPNIYDDGRYGRALICWIPGQVSPGKREALAPPLLSGKLVEETILQILSSLDEYAKDDYEARAMIRRPAWVSAWPEPLPGQVSYGWLCNRVRNKLPEEEWSARIYPAINRAVKRLAEAGRVQAHYGKVGRYAWVGLAKYCDVCNVYNRATLTNDVESRSDGRSAETAEAGSVCIGG